MGIRGSLISYLDEIIKKRERTVIINILLCTNNSKLTSPAAREISVENMYISPIRGKIRSAIKITIIKIIFE